MSLSETFRETYAHINLSETYYWVRYLETQERFCTFTKLTTQHGLCSNGPDLLCKFIKTFHTNEKNIYKHSSPVSNKYSSIWLRQTFGKYKHGKIQNQNDGLNNIILSKCVFLNRLWMKIVFVMLC